MTPTTNPKKCLKLKRHCTKCCQECGKLEVSHIAVERQNGSLFGKRAWEFLTRLNTYLLQDPVILLPVISSKQMKTYSYKVFYVNVPISFILTKILSVH